MSCLVAIDGLNGNEKAHVPCKILIRMIPFKYFFMIKNKFNKHLIIFINLATINSSKLKNFLFALRMP